jgi:hypothetical protein
MVSVEELFANYLLLSKEDQEEFLSHIKLANRKNASWKDIAPRVKAFAIERKRFSIKELKDAGIIPSKTPKQNFVKCVMPILEKEGFTLIEQKGVLPRNGSLFHIVGHALIVEEKAQTFFEEPNREAAKYFVDNILNGKIGQVDIRKLVPKDTFAFGKPSMNTFSKYVVDEAGKVGWRSGSNFFILTKKEEFNNE